MMEDKKAYQETMEARLSQLGARIDELQAKVQQTRTDVQADLNQQIEELKVKRDVTQQRLQELKASGGQAWKTLKSGFQSAWDKLSHAMEEAASKFDREQSQK
ncbi:hypothetical protein IQ238_22965 [Pleurocapsales cyanobacterium LEGE 06147]|nr:hypothetical protein [Pleurocapsales cyanobacterium LEGE 06147]